jgi:hypothetical protein
MDSMTIDGFDSFPLYNPCQALGQFFQKVCGAVQGSNHPINAVDRLMELHNVLEICCSWKSQKLLHVNGSHCVVRLIVSATIDQRRSINGTGAGALGQWSRGNGATVTVIAMAMAMGRGATSTMAMGQLRRRRSIAIAMALGQQEQGHWGNGNGATIDRSCFISQCKTSTIVVGESVQTVWLTNIPDVLCCD